MSHDYYSRQKPNWKLWILVLIIGGIGFQLQKCEKEVVKESVEVEYKPVVSE